MTQLEPSVTQRPLVVGVAGGSGSGKSRVVRELCTRFGLDMTTVVQHDAYYRDLSHLPPTARADKNFDHPDSLETELLSRHLRRLLDGKSVESPIYDFATHTRSMDFRRISPTPLVIVEGILVLVHKELRDLMDLRVFVHVNAEVRLARRVRRDTKDRGRTEASVLQQYERSVRPMHIEFVEPSRDYADITIEEGGLNIAAIDLLVEQIRSMIDASSTR